MTLFFWFVFLLAIVSLVAIPFQKRIGNAMVLVVMVAGLFILSLFAATYAFGYGHVPPSIEKIDFRLQNGVVYQLVYSEKQGDSYVLAVKKFGTDETMAIRTDTVPPEIFTLVNGQPVEIKK